MIYIASTLIVLLLASLYLNYHQSRTIKRYDENESVLIKKAYYNPITELPNRSNIDIVINEQIARAQRHKKSFLLAVVKVMNFQDVKLRNEDRAQKYIIEVGDRLLESIRDEDMLSHISENGFLIVFNEYLEDKNSDILFNRISNACKEPFSDAKGSLKIEIKMGKSKYPDDSQESENLINEATRAALDSADM